MTCERLKSEKAKRLKTWSDLKHPPKTAWAATDNMLSYLVRRADKLAAFADNPTAEAELEQLVSRIEVYQVDRWPRGKVAGGKG